MDASVEAPRPRLKFQFLEHTARQNMNPYAEGGDPLSSVFAPSKYGQEQASQATSLIYLLFSTFFYLIPQLRVIPSDRRPFLSSSLPLLEPVPSF
jgi:hypothetical protein